MSSWSREDGREKEERTAKVSEENEEEMCEKNRREEEKEENNTERVRRICEGFCFGGGFLKSSVKVVIWRVAVVFRGICWRIFKTGLSVSLTPRWNSVCVVLDVIDVLVTC